MVIIPITWITGLETIKRQTRAAYGCLVAGQSPWARARTQKRRCSCSCGPWHCVTVIYLSLCLLWSTVLEIEAFFVFLTQRRQLKEYKNIKCIKMILKTWKSFLRFCGRCSSRARWERCWRPTPWADFEAPCSSARPWGFLGAPGGSAANLEPGSQPAARRSAILERRIRSSVLHNTTTYITVTEVRLWSAGRLRSGFRI